MKTKKEKRLKISLNTQLKLWVCSGGRCQFYGCNEMLWKDGLTLREDNLSNIAHIIAASVDGPRGDKILSPKLARDFSNLMLMCTKHHKLIDGKNKQDFSVDLLRKFKTTHEERISALTEIQDNVKTTIFRFKANIGKRIVEVPLGQVQEAIIPKYPLEKGVLIDLSSLDSDGNGFMKTAISEIKRQVTAALTIGNDEKQIQHLSIFALGPIPLLIQLGHSISNAIPADIYQRHRSTDNWLWQDVKKDNKFKYIVRRPVNQAEASNVVLVLSLSGKIHGREVRNVLGKEASVWEITISSPDTSFLKTRDHLEKFRETYRKVLAEIRATHGNCDIHFFPAIPAPIAVMCGRELIHKADPHLLVYDLDNQGKFVKKLKIN